MKKYLLIFMALSAVSCQTQVAKTPKVQNIPNTVLESNTQADWISQTSIFKTVTGHMNFPVDSAIYKTGDNLSFRNISGKTKKAIVIGLDGIRYDAYCAAKTPVMDSLVNNRGKFFIVYSGGVPGTASQQLTSSGPSWTTVLTGVWDDQHLFVKNDVERKNSQYPSFLKLAETINPDYGTGSVTHWPVINTNILGDELEILDHHCEPKTVVESSKAAVEIASDSATDIMFVQFVEPDHVAHANTFSPYCQKYLDSINESDTYIQPILDAVKARPTFAQEDWLVVVCTDHGGSGNGHGEQSAGEKTIWMIVSYL